jgi:DNA-directed RNA polymerase II subunit RPB2
VNGFVKKYAKIKRDDVLIGKAVELPKPIDNYHYKDTSVVYHYPEEAMVEDIIRGRNQDGDEIAKIKYSSVRKYSIGDKFSSRHGQKGMTGIVYNQCDMMYTETGLIPDKILSPFAIPSRMTIGQLIEGLAGKLAAYDGSFDDSTIFREVDINAIGDELEKRGFDRYGVERMYNGMTGEWIDVEIFIAPTYYQRLQKFVVDEVYSISTGPTCIITRQPLEGKANNGGLRIGEMEKDVLISHGAGHFLMEKFRDDSDGFDVYICRTCKKIPVVNEEKNIIICKTCESAGMDPDVVKVRSTWSSKLFIQELESANIGVRQTIEPYEYEVFDT